MRVDFYQLGAAPLETVIANLAEKLIRHDERLLVVADEESLLARLDRMLWGDAPTSFIPHGLSGGTEDSRQPVLLSTTPDAANRARNILLADGKWRDAALAFHRAFYVFDSQMLKDARKAWRALASRDEIDRHYWANEDGRWTEKASQAGAS